MHNTVSDLAHHRPARRPELLRAAALVGLAAVLFAAGCNDDELTEDAGGLTPSDTAGDTSDVSDTSDASDTSEDASDVADTAGDADDGDATAFDLRLDGLSAPVTVQFDEAGVLHIDCQTNADCIAAQGYFHADHRFFEMDLVRRQTRGQLSKVIGQNFGLESDKKFRHLMTTREGEPLEEAYVDAVDDETKALLDAYARGVNVWLDDMSNGENGAELTEEYDFPIVSDDNIRDWEPEDTIALYLQLAYQLSFTAAADLNRGEAMGRLGLTSGDGNTVDEQIVSDLMTAKPGLESNIIDEAGAATTSTFDEEADGGSLDPAAMRGVRQRLAPAVGAISQARDKLESNPSLLFGPRTGSDGSNNWVLDGSRTDSGRPLLANDPHLSLNNPAIWYHIELDSKTNGEGDLHVAGASIPSVPGIVAGHNEDVAWGMTTAGLDLADAYVETLTDDGNKVVRDGNEIELIQKDYTLEGKNGNAETVTFEWVPDHGPLLSKDTDANRGVSVKWVAQNPGNDIDFIDDLLTAGSVDEAMDAMGPIRAINQCWVFMDRNGERDDGEIGWYPKGAIPKRPWASAETPNWLPLPGDGSSEWQGHLSEEENPKLVNPAAGFVATANNDFDGSYTDGDATNDGHTPWQTIPASGHRHKRIVEMIDEGGDTHTPDTMHDIQADTHSLHGETLVPEVLDVADANTEDLSSDAQAVVDALDDWDYTCPTGLDGSDPEEADAISDPKVASEAIGCSAFHVLLPSLIRGLFADELEPIAFNVDGGRGPLQKALIYAMTASSELAGGTDYFDDVATDDTTETKAEIVTSALDETAANLADTFGSSTADDWRWGRIHTVTFTSLFSSTGVDNFDNGPFANDGGLLTVDVANPVGDNNEFHHPNGPSIRMVYEARDEEIQGWFQLPGGQDHHRDSRWYGSLIDEWLTNEPTKLLFDRQEVDDNAVETLSVGPAE